MLRFDLPAIVLTLAILLLWGLVKAQAPESYTLARGTVSATDQEQQECYFTFGSGQTSTVVITHPKNIACDRLRALVGRRGALVFAPDE